MTDDHDPTTVPNRLVTVDGVSFRLAVHDGRYVWHTRDKRAYAGQNDGNAMCWAVCDGKLIADHYPGLKLAMRAAVRAMNRNREAA
jgi:hypothetical protein